MAGYSYINKLINTALSALKHSHSPHSKFRVGAAILTGSGKIYPGVNVEFDAYSLTVCAERAALFNALSNGEKKIIAVSIATNSKKFKYPCGLCRQALVEFNPLMEIILVNSLKKSKKVILKDLIPEFFKL